MLELFITDMQITPINVADHDIKAQLMDTLATWMESENLTQDKAATVLGISRTPCQM